MFKRLAISVAVLVTSTTLLAQTPAPTVRLRATIEKVDATSITVKERSGEVITLVRPADMDVSEVYALALADIKPGIYIGTAGGARRQSADHRAGKRWQTDCAAHGGGAKRICTAHVIAARNGA